MIRIVMADDHAIVRAGFRALIEQEAGFEIVAMALRDDAVPLAEFAGQLRQAPRKIALLLGTEGDGLSAHWLDQADAVVRITMHHGVDSLNVAAAAAVACFALAE